METQGSSRISTPTSLPDDIDVLSNYFFVLQKRAVFSFVVCSLFWVRLTYLQISPLLCSARQKFNKFLSLSTITFCPYKSCRKYAKFLSGISIVFKSHFRARVLLAFARSIPDPVASLSLESKLQEQMEQKALEPCLLFTFSCCRLDESFS